MEEGSFQLLEDQTKRLDVLLSEHYGQSRNYFEALIQQGAVRVNGQQRKKSFKKFRSGDVIDVRFLVDIRTLPLEPEAMDLDILYEDDELLVINKAAGLVVHPAPGNWNGTLVNGVLHHLGFASSELSTLPNAAELRPGIVHRLDVGTTGVIAVAKTVSSYSVLSQAFAQREVQKTYLAVVLGGRKSFFGHPKGSGHRVEKAIGRSTTDRRLMTTLDGGRPALSFVRGIAREKELLLVEVKPRTGRTHQIRVHLADEHSPILGDTAYGWHHMNRRYAQLAQRPMLHAFELSLQHPSTAERLTFRAPLPEDMRQLIRRMQPEVGESLDEFLS